MIKILSLNRELIAMNEEQKKKVISPPPKQTVSVSREIIKGMEDPQKKGRRELQKGK